MYIYIYIYVYIYVCIYVFIHRLCMYQYEQTHVRKEKTLLFHGVLLVYLFRAYYTPFNAHIVSAGLKDPTSSGSWNKC